MNAATSAAETALRNGDAAGALKLLTDQVRARPQDAKLRTFLFQLLVVLGQWDRALNQLGVAAELDAAALPMAQTYREAIHCETLRLAVFAGQKVPMLFGEPEPWTALLVEALLREGRGEPEAGAQLRAQALDEAPASAGTLDGEAFEWIADADSRLGPTLEAVINGRYYWLPFNRLQQVTIEAPADLRDAVWMPAHFTFANGGETVGLIPTRYPDTEIALGDANALARRTEWRERPHGLWVGLGQRLITTSASEKALMDIRLIEMAA
jgi:type VI secretion system protein ImpE